MKRKIIRIDADKCNGCGLTRIAREALEKSGTKVPFEEVVIAIEGKALDR